MFVFPTACVHCITRLETQTFFKMFFTLCLVRVRVCSESTRAHTQRRPLFSQHSAGMFCFVVDQALTIARLAIRLREAQLRDEPRLACTAGRGGRVVSS